MTSAVSEAIDGVRDVLSRAGESIIVAGKPAPAADGRLIETCDPATGEVIASIAAGSATDVDRAVAAATRAMGPWGDLSAAARARVLYDIASLIEAGDSIGILTSLDGGGLQQRRLDEPLDPEPRHGPAASHPLGAQHRDVVLGVAGRHTRVAPVTGIQVDRHTPMMSSGIIVCLPQRHQFVVVLVSDVWILFIFV